MGAQRHSVTIVLRNHILQRSIIHSTLSTAIVKVETIAVHAESWMLYTVAIQDTSIADLRPKNGQAHDHDDQGKAEQKHVKYFHDFTPFIDCVWVR